MGGAAGYLAVPTAEDAKECYRLWVLEQPDLIDRIKKELQDKDLICSCPLIEPCHVDILLEMANRS